ncbi:MAG: AMP-binding protein [Burkholderiales bacterium]
MNLPLARHRSLEDVIVWREGKAILVAEFLSAARQLAARLPDQAYVFNLCLDRYHFLLGFAAALMKRQVSLLPPARSEHLLRDIRAHHRPAYCLIDHDCATAGLPAVQVRHEPGSGAEDIPFFPADQRAVIAFTSGSTGVPNPHEKTWATLLRIAAATAERFGFLPGQNIVGTVPPQHMYGLETTIMLPLQSGGALHSGHPLTPADIAAALSRLPAPRWLAATPLHLKACVSETAALPKLAGIICATMPLAPELAKEVEQLAPLHEIYGCTEAGTVATRRPAATQVFEACAELVFERRGEDVWLSGASLPQAVRLPDRVRLVSSTEFVFLARATDMVKIAGKRASLSALNSELMRIPEVRDGVFYFPEGATRLMAFAVAPEMTAQELLAQLRNRIDPAFLPRPLVLLDQLPRNSTGKLPREDLARLAVAASIDAS